MFNKYINLEVGIPRHSFENLGTGTIGILGKLAKNFNIGNSHSKHAIKANIYLKS